MSPLSLLRRIVPAVLFAGAVLAAPAHAVELGLNMNGGAAAGTAQNFSQVAESKAGWTRYFLYWDQQSAETLAAYDATARDDGAKTLLVVTGNSAPDADRFAAFMKDAAQKLPNVDAFEIWNEWDGEEFWPRDLGADPHNRAYPGLLAKAYDAVKSVAPSKTVLMGPTIGNNYHAIEAAIQGGARDKFDAVAVHTNTACSDRGPGAVIRDQGTGRINQYAFLGYKEVRQTLVANGQDRPVWMTEFGWAVSDQLCDQGMWKGQKPAGVSPADQATFLAEAVGCMNEHPGVAVALWFNNRDLSSGHWKQHYGLFDVGGAARPAWQTFKTVAANPGAVRNGQPCGDFQAPPVEILRPVPGEKYFSSLIVKATSSAGDVMRVTFAADGNEIRNFTNSGQPLTFNPAPELDWQGARNLSVGPHTVRVTAVDAAGNSASSEVQVEKVSDPSQVTTAPVRFDSKRTKLSRGKRNTWTLKGRILSDAGKVTGKVQAVWQNKRKGKWKKIHGGLKSASKPFTFKQKLKYSGSWRVRVQWGPGKPFNRATSCWLTFTTKSKKVKQVCSKTTLPVLATTKKQRKRR